MSTLLALAGAFFLTVVLEGGAVFLLTRKGRPVYVSFLCNLLTNPAANALVAGAVLWLGEGAYFPCLLPVELAVVGAEAWVYRLLLGFPGKRPWAGPRGSTPFPALRAL